MPFGGFALLSLFYVFIGVRVVRDLWVHRREAFDLRFTEPDRYLVDQAAFFLLVPISVLLHEFGHAVAIWLFGGEVIDFNYYVFAGSVSYLEPFTNTEHTIVAAAGTVVNIILCALALAVVFLKRNPYRAAINELLFQFAVISGINALIFYPLLDFATGMNGDWTQMYDGGERTLTVIILIIHASLLIGSYLLWQSPRFRATLAQRTGMPAATDRRVFGGLRRSAQPPTNRGVVPQPTNEISFEPTSPAEARFRAAADRVARGWSEPVQGRVDRRDNGSQVALVWRSSDVNRAVAMRYENSGQVMLSGAATIANPDAPRDHASSIQRGLRVWADVPDENDLTLSLRMAMEEVERWNPTPAPYSS
jgi:hypothetical protein